MQVLKYIEWANKYKQVDPANFSARIRINLMTNFTDNALQKILLGTCLENNIFPSLYSVPYKQYNFFLNDKNSEIHLAQADVTFIFFDVNHYITSAFTQDTSHFADMLARIEEFCAAQSAPVIFCTFILPYMGPFGNLFEQNQFYVQIQEYNAQLKKLAERQKNLFIFDINRLVHFLGEKNIRDYRGLYAFDMPFTNDFFCHLTHEWLSYIFSLVGKTKKCIVVDLDNTLWGGVVGEVGAKGIDLGSDYPGVAFQNFQRALLACYHRGLILAINSRNNEEDVNEVFEKNPNMILKKEHFAAVKINWNDKAQNLVEIAKDLNIGMDSLVFFDDDPVNREVVKSSLPDVLVPHFTISPEEYVDKLFTLNIFNQFRLTEEDKLKGEMYAAESQRKNILASVKSPEEYIASLGISIQVDCNTAGQIERLAQLTMKTNQFNLTTHRYTESQIKKYMESGLVYGGTVRDKFGEYGLTVLAIILIKEKVAYIDSFLMSCRVMGREVEYVFLDYLLRELYKKGISKIEASYIATAKNTPAKNFYNKLGFINQQNRDQENIFELSLEDYIAKEGYLNHGILIKTNN